MRIKIIKEELKKYGFNSYQHTEEVFNELKEQFIEMAQLKSDFDIEKFTIKKEGNFIAHNFHFLMRQYSLTLFELRRLLIEKEDCERRCVECTELSKKEILKLIVYQNGEKIEKYMDLYIKELINRIDMLDINIANKAMVIKGFEKCRLKLIEINGSSYPTNEQYQKECPEYWKWFLINKAKEQRSERETGIREGVWENIRYLEEEAVINPAFKVKMLDQDNRIDLNNKEKLLK